MCGKVSLAHTISKPLVSLPLMCRFVSLAVSWEHLCHELWDGCFPCTWGYLEGLHLHRETAPWELGFLVGCNQERCYGMVLQSWFYPPLISTDNYQMCLFTSGKSAWVAVRGNWAIKELKVGAEWILWMKFDSSASLMVKFFLRKEKWNVQKWSNFYSVSVY